MRRSKLFAFSFLLFLFLTACGQTGVTNPPVVEPEPPTPPSEDVQASLLLFAAPWCGPCKAELPEVQRLYNERLASKKGQLVVEVWVTTGETQTKNPTQEIADQYGQTLGLSFPMKPDVEAGARFPKWSHYRKYFPTGFALPTAVVLNRSGEVLKTFTGAAPVEVIEFVESQLN